MNAKPILNVCLKVVGVFYALKALNMLPSSIFQIILTSKAFQFPSKYDAMDIMFNYKVASLIALLIPVILFIISLIIILKSEKIVDFILSKESTLEEGSYSDLHSIALNISLKIFGCFSIISAVPYLSEFISKFLIMGEDVKLYGTKGKIELLQSAISTGLFIVAGAILIIYSSVIANKISPEIQGTDKESIIAET